MLQVAASSLRFGYSKSDSGDYYSILVHSKIALGR